MKSTTWSADVMSRLSFMKFVPQGLLAAIALGVLPALLTAQDRLRSMPGFERYNRMASQINSSVQSGALSVTWIDSGKALEYTRDGKRWRLTIGQPDAVEAGTAPTPSAGRGGGRGGGPERGRQFVSADAPVGGLRAFYRDRNIWVSNLDGSGERAVTSDGSAEDRIKYGTASWVYGEELGQRTAMWWSPDGKRLAFYRFDEKPVPDFYLQLGQTKIQSELDVEAYPKAGVDNPVVDLFVYDVATSHARRIAVRDGKPFTDDVVGHYVYAVRWSPDGSELLIHRTNRRQNVLELAACAPATGSCRVVVREEWPASWVDNTPTFQFLADGKRFIWESERTGWKNYYLYDLSGQLITALTNHQFEVASIVRVDEAARALYYMARDGDNHMKMQLHRVGLDGRNDRRLTDPAFNHTVSLAPDGRHFADIAQAHDQPAVTRLLDVQGRVVKELAKSDLARFDSLGLRRAELLTFKAADSTTILHGLLQRPSNFDSTRTYPVLVSVYAGPATNGARETFVTPSALTEFGFLVVTLDARSAAGRGKRFLDAIYEKLGVVEVDDLAAGVKSLWSRPYVDRARVGIYGTSYGGYASAMAILRYPDVFAAASAASAVTDWRHYDTIYTERYMYTPQVNTAAYDSGSAMTYAANLKGRLMIYYGTADNNVHPNNSMQLIQALQRAGKSFDVQVGPDAGHSGLNQQRMMEFFIENLVIAGNG
jgi:dipeptidyl-peptidase-4